MSMQIAICLMIELALIVITSFLLIQPNYVFHGQSNTIKNLAKSTGYIFLCLTFFCSVILGCIFELSHLRFTI
ncbi:MAG: hypothetical protein HY072_01210 [Deltaproteobacteria bacterium]|nr:hypothetical protein [Deltaproteobacteria bacterium]